MDVATRDSLSEGRSDLARGDWATARDTLVGALSRDDDPEVCYELARAQEWAGDYEAAVRLYERAFAGLRARGEIRAPAFIAGRELSFLHAAVFGNAAAAGGWLARARSLAAEAGECPESGWVALAEALAADAPRAMAEHARRGERIAARFADGDLHFCALAYEGTAHVFEGRVGEGMRSVDEAAVAALSGEVRDHLVIGEIYCKMLLCCEVALDVRRARQWSTHADAFGRASHDLWVSGICRMHYGGILVCAGRWSEADEQLSTSLRIHDAGMRALRGGTAVRLADLRIRQGRLGEAAVLLSGNEHDGAAAVPMARLLAARGDRGTAVAVLRRAVDRGGVLPQAPALALLAELLAEDGALEQARLVVDRVAVLARRTGLPHLTAMAEEGRAIAGAGGDRVARLRDAVLAYTEAGLPWDTAVARLRLAHRLASTDPEAAVREARAALERFQELGSRRRADEAARLLRLLGVRPGPRAAHSAGLSAREAEVLRLVAAGRSNAEIARELFVSKRTVEHHVGSIFTKMGVTTRGEAIARALQVGPGNSRPHGR